jgi:heparanase 1
MIRNGAIGYAAIAILVGAGIAACRTSEPSGASRTAPTAVMQSSMARVGATGTAPTALMPSSMARVGTVDERFQSYNVEMLEVTGGKFWKPYKDIGKPAAQPSAASGSQAQGGETPAGMSAELYQYRPPIDLTNRRLRAMARALGPAYMRISGTWANTTYFSDTDPPPKDPPKGYGGVLTRQQWLGALDFSRAVDAPIVTSMPNGMGTRGADGLWRPDQARRWLAFTKANGGTVAAAEYFNEPTMASMGGAPKGYDAAAFGRDYRVFTAFMRKEYPGTKLLAPGSVGEANADWAVAKGGYGAQMVLPAAELAVWTGDADAFSYHHYGAVSKRCAAMGHQTSADQALTEDWLGRTDVTLAFYRGVRDKAMPGRHFWNTETADAACGGNPWASTFLDTFRYLDQLGRLARQEVDVVIHNTLVASDYGLLDENSFAPKPNFWGALLWRKLMGTTVLESGVPIAAGFHVYAHCLRGVPSGVALMVINTDTNKAGAMNVPASAMRYTLRATQLQGTRVELNGKVLELGRDDALPALAGTPTAAGEVSFEPASITFLALAGAANNACR